MELPVRRRSTSSPERPDQPEPGRGLLELDEELVLMAAEGEGDPEEEAEGSGDREDPTLFSVIRQKERDLMLAARLGKALLERNQDMSRRYEEMQRELTERLEVRAATPECTRTACVTCPYVCCKLNMYCMCHAHLYCVVCTEYQYGVDEFYMCAG